MANITSLSGNTSQPCLSGSRIAIAGMEFSTGNLGDEIQAIAAEQFVERVDVRYDRDKLHVVKPDRKYLIILNGWFCWTPEQAFPPAQNLVPIIIGFHIDRKAKDHLLSPLCLAYFRQFEPVGCRDRQTQSWLQDAGIDAYLSKCLTLTFETRKRLPDHPQVILVDVKSHVLSLIPKKLRRGAVTRSHLMQDRNEDRRGAARKLLDFYRDHAGLIITSRLHCALPCVAMGIPVVFFADKHSYRISVAKDCGLPVHSAFLFLHRLKKFEKRIPAILYRSLRLLDQLIMTCWYKYIRVSTWRPRVLDIGQQKMELIDRLRQEMELGRKRYDDYV